MSPHDATAELAAAKEWNLTRAGQFAATEQRLAAELATLQLLAESMAEDLEAIERGASWALLCMSPSEPALAEWRRHQKDKAKP